MDNNSYTSDSSSLFNVVKLYGSPNMKAIEIGFGDSELSESLSKYFDIFFTFDIQKQNLVYARKKNLKNIFISDVKQPGIKSHEFDICIFNPPFFKLGEGVLSENESRNINRHEIKGTLNDFVNCALDILKSNGQMIFIIPLNRLSEIRVCAQTKIDIKFISIAGSSSKKARAVIVAVLKAVVTTPQVVC